MSERGSLVRYLMVFILSAVPPALAPAAQPMVSSNYSHTCALNAGGGVKCWGDNSKAQLGDYTTTERHLPVDVWGLASGVATIATGGQHTCAVTTAGGLKCWGDNSKGQLGDNATIMRYTPVDVPGLNGGVAAITVGWDHSCALTMAGGVKCWGDNSYGQLGDNTTADRHSPIDVPNLTSGVTAIAAGEFHTCALTTAGGVKCWGWNAFGQLGDNSTSDRHMPVDVSGLTTGVTGIAAGVHHTCAVTATGGAKCWGSNIYYPLGNNTIVSQFNAPVDVWGLNGVAVIAAGFMHTCVLTTAGGLKCWGGYNVYGAPSGDSSGVSKIPVDVSGFASGVAGIAAGYDHTCVLMATGDVKCWGGNNNGQLGDNTRLTRNTPADVIGLTVPGATVPDFPIIGAVTPGNGQATVSFGAPANDGGSPITVYTVTASPGGMTATAGASPITITGLTNGTIYTFTVTGTNAMGTGAASTASAAVTPLTTVLTFASGWNLVGNGVEAPITVATTFNDASKVTSIWKWVSAGTTPGIAYPTWAFYSPTQTDGGRAYAASHGYDFLTAINAGEGFWVNARAAFFAYLPSGAAVQSSSFKPAVAAMAGGTHALPHGWSLIAAGDNPTPAQFDAAIATVQSLPPAVGSAGVYTNLTTLWAWDAANQKWFFWSPSLVNSGGLASYIAGKGYRDFAAMPATPTGTLSPATGLWVNMP